MRKLHGNLHLEEDGFFKKVTQKDRKLNGQAAQRYYSNWADKKEHERANNEESVEGRREQAQNMTNAFYDLVTDFYEYGTYCSLGFLILYSLNCCSCVKAGANRSTLPSSTKVSV